MSWLVGQEPGMNKTSVSGEEDWGKVDGQTSGSGHQMCKLLVSGKHSAGRPLPGGSEPGK